ncbi:MAG: hypothetical protein WAV47_20980 [Blastocatellia bacterium]
MPPLLAKSASIAFILVATCVRCDTSSPAAIFELNGARLKAAARAAGDYLIRMQKHDGSFHYYYNAAADRFEPRRYNIVRHAGTAVSLFDLYRATRDVRFLGGARRAVTFLTSRFHRARTANAAYVLDYDGKAKLGSNGLALVALASQIELDAKSARPQNAARLANLILVMQHRDGSFKMRYRIGDSEPQGIDSLYYPGEAILGLVRLYRSNPDKRLLEGARRGANFLIESQQRMSALPPDAWLMQALEALYNIGHERRYADHAIALAEAMIAAQYTGEDPAGYAGGFGPGSPRATPAASRAEGLVSAYRIARSLGDRRAQTIAASLRACATFQLSQQFTAVNSKTLRNPRRAAGGFREGLTSFKVRIDFVQHNISSLLGIAEALY